MSAARQIPAVPPLYRGLVRRSVAAALALTVAGVAVPLLGRDRPVPLQDVQRVAAQDVPTGITVTAPTEGSRLAVRWNAVAGAEQYKVYVYTGTNQGTGVVVNSSTTSYVAPGLVNGTTYNVVVSSVKMVLAVIPVESKSTAFTGTPADTAPGTPVIGTATVADRSSVVSWTSPGDGDIARFEVVNAAGTVVATAAGIASTSVTVPNLVNGTSYAFRVRAVDATAHTGNVSAAVTVTPRDSVAPAAPAALTATGADRTATLTWTAPTDYDVARYDLLAADGTVVGTVPAGTTTTVLTGLVNGTAYGYRVRAVDTSGNQGAASPVVTVTPRDAVPPGAPTGLTATPADRSAVLVWTPPADDDVARYEVLDQAGAVLTTVPVGTATATVTGLVNGTPTTLRVRAVDTSGNPGLPATTTVTPRDGLAPAYPSGLVATSGDRQATLSWNAPADQDVARYEILDAGGNVLRQVPVGTTSTTWTGLVNGTPYTVSIRTVDTSGNVSPASPAVTTTPRDATAPGAPRNFTIGPNDRSANFAWLSPGDYDVSGYVLYDGSGNEVKTITAPSTATYVTGLVNGRTYTYYLKTRDTSGNVSSATPVKVVVPRDSVAPGAPRALTSTVEDRRTTLSWTAPGDGDLATYQVLDASGAVVATVSAPTRTVVVTGLTNGVPSTFTVRAVDTSGNSGAASGTTTVTPRDTTAPAAPTDLTATPADRSAVLSWTAPGDPASDDVASYDVLAADGTVLLTVPAGTTTATVTGLVNGTSSTLRVRATDTSQNSSVPSAPVTVVPGDTVAPAAPTALAAVPGDRSAVLTWVAPADGDVLRYEVVSAAGTVVAVVPAGTTSATVSGLGNGTPVTFTVRAVDTSRNTGPATAPVEVTPVDGQAPAAPTAVTATGSDSRITVSWVTPADTDLASYRVLAADGTVLATVPAGTTTTSLAGLPNGVPVTVFVTATDTSGNTSPLSGPVTATPRDSVAPAAPTGVTAVAGDGSATFTWTPAADADVARYEVRTGDGTVVGSFPAPAAGGVVTGLLDGRDHDLVVVAVDTSGNVSAPSAAVRVTPQGAAQVTGVQAVPTDTAVALSWTAVVGAAGYEVLQDGAVVATVTTPAATVVGLTNGQAYSFTVRAVTAAGSRGAASVAVSATPFRRPTGGTPVTGSGSSGFGVSRDGRFVVVATREQLEASDTNSISELYLVDQVTGAARRLAPQAGTATTSDPVQGSAVAVSAGGRYVAVVTSQRLVAGDTNTLPDVYRLDTVTDAWELVSVPVSGATSASVAGTLLQTGASVYATGPSVAVSADGQRVFFYSARADLVAGDTNASVDLFAKDMVSGAVKRVSTTATGASISKVVTGPALAATPDGRFAVFPAAASNGPITLLRKDLVTGELVTVSTVVRAGQVTEFGVFRDAGDVAVSDDGRFVVLSTTQKVLTSAPGASLPTGLAYRKDVQTGELLALGSGQSGAWEHRVAIDPSGRYGFYSTISADVAGDRNSHTDVYRRDLGTGELSLVTSRGDGSATPTAVSGSVEPKEYGYVVALTGDRVVVTTMQALDATDTNKVVDTYVRDIAAGVAASAVRS